MVFQINDCPLAELEWHLSFDLRRNICIICLLHFQNGPDGATLVWNLEFRYLEIILTACGKLCTPADLKEEKQYPWHIEHVLISRVNTKDVKRHQGDGTRIMGVLKEQWLCYLSVSPMDEYWVHFQRSTARTVGKLLFNCLKQKEVSKGC